MQGMQRFVRGLARHGIKSEVRRTSEHQVDCDIAVFWGHRQQLLILRQKEKKAHYLVMERGYVGDRFFWTSLGFDGLNGRAKFPVIDDGGRRWRQFFQHHMQELQKANGQRWAIVMGQVLGDCAVQHVNFLQWAIDAGVQLRKRGYEPAFRPHPQDPHRKIPAIPTHAASDIRAALAEAKLVVTYNSNSGVDALLAGVPTVAMDIGSMAYPVAMHEIGDPIWNSRDAWAARLAYCQWMPDEIESGYAWESLQTCLPL